MPHDHEPKPSLESGVDPDAPTRRWEKWAVFLALAPIVAIFGSLLTAVSVGVSLLAAVAMIAGVRLIVGSLIGPGFISATGLCGVALVLAGVAMIRMLRRYDLDP